jgi:hypothetical protein
MTTAKQSPPPAVARRAIIEFDRLSRIMASKRIMDVCRRARRSAGGAGAFSGQRKIVTHASGLFCYPSIPAEQVSPLVSRQTRRVCAGRVREGGYAGMTSVSDSLDRVDGRQVKMARKEDRSPCTPPTLSSLGHAHAGKVGGFSACRILLETLRRHCCAGSQFR